MTTTPPITREERDLLEKGTIPGRFIIEGSYRDVIDFHGVIRAILDALTAAEAEIERLKKETRKK